MRTGAALTKKDHVVEVLREAILSGQLSAGEKLLQDKLAERFSISSTPIREALRQLAAEGVVDQIPRRGVRVAEIDLSNLRDTQEIFLIRGSLESLATRLAVPYLNNTHIGRLRMLLNQMEQEVRAGQLRRLRRCNYDFHMIIYRASNMPQLLRMIRNLWTRFPWDTLQVIPGRAGVAASQHGSLIDAIRDGNSRLAGELMEEHINQAGVALAEYLYSKQAGLPDAT